MKLINKDKPERHFIVVKNSETSSIAKESPVCFYISGTDDGLCVKKPASLTAGTQDVMLAGVPANDLVASTDGQLVQVFGMTPHTVTIRLQTRANSTQSVQTFPALAVGAPLLVDTVNNAFYAAASVAAASAYQVNAWLGATLAGASDSIVGTDIASSGANSAWYGLTVSTLAAKVFLRIL